MNNNLNLNIYLNIFLLALVLFLSSCGGGNSAEKEELSSSMSISVKYKAASDYGYSISKITSKISRLDFAKEIELSIDDVNKTASGEYSEIAIGEYSIEVKVYSGETQIAEGLGKANVERDNIVTSEISIEYFTGNLVIDVNLDDGSPSTVPVDGLIAYYPFTGNTEDVSGNSHDGVENGVTLVEDRFGNANSAYHFDGVNDYIRVSIPLSGNLDWTICAWVNSSATNSAYTDWQDLISNVDEGFAIGFRTADEKYKIYDSGIDLLSSTDGVVLNDDVFMCFQKSLEKLKMYKDGSVTGISSLGGSVDFSELMVIGSWVTGANSAFDREPWNGKIDDIRIYNRALLYSEIQALYHEGGWDIKN